LIILLLNSVILFLSVRNGKSLHVSQELTYCVTTKSNRLPYFVLFIHRSVYMGLRRGY